MGLVTPQPPPYFPGEIFLVLPQGHEAALKPQEMATGQAGEVGLRCNHFHQSPCLPWLGRAPVPQPSSPLPLPTSTENTFTGRRWEPLTENQKLELAQQQLRQCLGPCCADSLFKRKKKRSKSNNNNIEHAKRRRRGLFQQCFSFLFGETKETLLPGSEQWDI